MTTLRVAVLLVLAVLAPAARAQEAQCPPGAVELSRQVISAPDGDTLRLTCRRIRGLTQAQLDAVSPETRAKLSPDDRAALDRRRAELSQPPATTVPDAVARVVPELPGMPDAELTELERQLAAEQRSPAAFSLLLALGAALGSVGGLMMFGGLGKSAVTAKLPGMRRGMALGALLGLGVLSLGYSLAAGGLPLLPYLSDKAEVEVQAQPIGFAPGTAQSALQSLSRVQHAVDHLTKQGVMPNWSKETGQRFVEFATDTLERPTATFDYHIHGTLARGFAGKLNGQDVVVFVYKVGDMTGQLASAWIPSAGQAAHWGLNK